VKIIIDADACPKTVLNICLNLGRQYGIAVWTVASYKHNIVSDHHLTVDSDSQEADLKIINIAAENDIVITQDWGLAAMLLGKEAKVVNPVGREYRSEKIEFMLEEREIKAKARRSGVRTRGPGKRTAKDDRRFHQCLENIIIRLLPDIS